MKKAEKIIAGVLLALIAVNSGMLYSLRGQVMQLESEKAEIRTALSDLLKQVEKPATAPSELAATPVETPVQETVNVKLSPYLYAAPGQELNIYFDNIIDDKDNHYDFNVICEICGLYEGFYRVIPEISNAGGVFPLTIQVIDRGSVVGSAATQLVVAEEIEEARPIRCMMIGDSIVAQNDLVFALREDLDAAGIPVVFLGTQGETPCLHEGRGGWTAEKYVHHEDSPFVFDGDFDFTRYMQENGYGQIDYIFIVLGINDFFHVSDDDTEHKIADTLADYHEMIDGIRGYDERIRIGLCVTIPPAYTEDAFGARYGTLRPRWRYKLINFAWINAMIDEFRENENADLVPINVNLDTKNNMGQKAVRLNIHSTATRTVTALGGHVHPDQSGYWQLADEIYCYLRCMEAEIAKETSN